MIKYIKDLDYVGTDDFTGDLEVAMQRAAEGLKKFDSDTAAIMDKNNPKGRPVAVMDKST